LRRGSGLRSVILGKNDMDKKEAKKEIDRISELLESDWLSDRSREELELRQRELFEIMNRKNI
jgi:hypothetical protein